MPAKVKNASGRIGILLMLRKLGYKRGHFITNFLQHENMCKMVRKVINNLLSRQGEDSFFLEYNWLMNFLTLNMIGHRYHTGMV